MASKSGTHLVAMPMATEEETPAKKPAGKRAVASTVQQTAEDTTVIGQLKLAATPKNRLALIVGILLGGLVPFLSYILAHYECDGTRPLWQQIPAYLVAGGLAYSAKSVYEWGTAAFHSSWKAIGFLLLVEGAMITSHIQWMGIIALCYLVGINAVNTGVNLALQQNKRA